MNRSNNERPKMFRMDRPFNFSSDSIINVKGDFSVTPIPPVPNNFLLLDNTDFLLLDNTNLLLL